MKLRFLVTLVILITGVFLMGLLLTKVRHPYKIIRGSGQLLRVTEIIKPLPLIDIQPQYLNAVFYLPLTFIENNLLSIVTLKISSCNLLLKNVYTTS